MNRAERRARQRFIQRDLHDRFGCRRRPTITRAAAEYAHLEQPGATLYDTNHDVGCPLGNVARELGESGYTLIGNGLPYPRCVR